ncbi:MAG: hypothetical protein E7020_07065 [Alphaproteobacteria bacterium]|nr:hypothetical protein [Alphaproteobacteria bacterium]
MNWKNKFKEELVKMIKRKTPQPQEDLEPNNGLDYLNKVYELLQELGIVESKQQFSEQFLGKSKFYYGVLDCEKRKVGCHLLHDLTLNLKQIKECFNNNQLNELIKEGQQILRQRVEKYYNL